MTTRLTQTIVKRFQPSGGRIGYGWMRIPDPSCIITLTTITRPLLCAAASSINSLQPEMPPVSEYCARTPPSFLRVPGYSPSWWQVPMTRIVSVRPGRASSKAVRAFKRRGRWFSWWNTNPEGIMGSQYRLSMFSVWKCNRAEKYLTSMLFLKPLACWLVLCPVHFLTFPITIKNRQASTAAQ